MSLSHRGRLRSRLHLAPSADCCREERTRRILHHDPEIAKGGERPILGGLKTKDVDVTVMIPAVGPVLAISLKGISKSFRNLTNRMEEAVGDCTNLHMAYPALVCGFWQLLRANEEDYPEGAGSIKLVDGAYDRDDVSFLSGGQPTDKVARYSRALERLSGRNDLREPPSTYEACALTVVQCRGTPAETRVYSSFPRRDAGLDANEMFKKLYSCYDRRFVYLASKLEKAHEARDLGSRITAIGRHCSRRRGIRRNEAEDRIGQVASSRVGFTR